MKFIRFLSFFLLIFCTNKLYAEVKIVIIDTNQIVEKCTACVQAKKVIEDEFNRYEKQAGEMQEKFSKKATALENKKNIMATKEYNKKRDELTKEAQILQKKFYEQRVNLDKKFNNVNKILNDNLVDIIKKLSEKKHITVAMDKGMLLYNDESIEITDEVMSEINKKLKSIDLNLPQSKSGDPK